MLANRWNNKNLYTNGYAYTNNTENDDEKDIKGLLKKNRILKEHLENSLEENKKLKLQILLLNNELKKLQS